jgi:metal-responsive CopG/Arc/MetJ family transcriptional regulator
VNTKTRTKPQPRGRSGGRGKPVSMRLENGLVEDLDAIAARVGETRSSLVEIVLRKYVTDRGVEKIVKEARNDRTARIFE